MKVIAVPGDKMIVNVTGLEPGTEYTFSIISEGADGQKSPISGSVMASTLNPGEVKCCSITSLEQGGYKFVFFPILHTIKMQC